MLGKALRVSATVARGYAERVAARSGYGAQERLKFRWVLLARLCACTSGHTLCSAVLTRAPEVDFAVENLCH